MIPQELEQQVSYLKKVSHDEYSSSCPNCGGSIHHDGSQPDRFRIFLQSKTTGGVMGWCRQCDYMWFPDDQEKYIAPSPEILQKRAAAVKQLEKEQIEGYLINIKEMQKGKPWEKYNQALADHPEIIALFEERLIEDFWIDYWQLGYCDRKAYSYKDGLYYCPSVTIPLQASISREVFNIRHRLLHPVDTGNKYRPEIGGLPSGLFLCDLDRPLEGKCLIVEGEFKAMTTYLKLNDPDMHVVGIPGKKPNGRMFKKLDKCDPIYICMDPDAYVSERGGQPAITRLAKMINERGKDRARIITVPGKIDDMIAAGYLDQAALEALLKTARKSLV